MTKTNIGEKGEILIGNRSLAEQNQSSMAVGDTIEIEEQTLSTTLLASGWIGSSAPYTQAVVISGVTVNSKVEVTPVFSTTLATAIAQKEACACVSTATLVDTTSGGVPSASINFKCFEEKPSVDIPIFVEVS